MEVPTVRYRELKDQRLGEPSRAVRERVLPLPRTAAVLEGADGIGATHVSEAVHYRPPDRLIRG